MFTIYVLREFRKPDNRWFFQLFLNWFIYNCNIKVKKVHGTFVLGYKNQGIMWIKLFTLPVIHQWRCLSHVILMLLNRNVSNYWHSWWPHNWTKPVTSGSCANTRAVTCAHSVTIFNQIQIFVLVPLWGWLLVIIHFIQILVFPEIWKKIFIDWCNY